MTWGGPNLPTGVDQFDRKQQPQVEPADDLSRFVLNRIYKAETEPAVDGVPRLAHSTNGAIAHRYAGKVREDMVAFRRVVAWYVDVLTSPVSPSAQDALLEGLRVAVRALAMRWEKDPEFRDEWRLTE